VKNRLQVHLGILSLLFTLFGVSACKQLPQRPGADVQVTPGRLGQLNPSDVVVAPIINKMERAEAPEHEIREAFQAALVRRRYSPLALDFVDSRVVDAAYRPGALQEEAVLQIVVHDWDDSKWETRTALIVDIEAVMIDASGPTGEALWSGRLTKRYNIDTDRSRFATQAQMRREACQRVAVDLMAAMPGRATEPGRE